METSLFSTRLIQEVQALIHQANQFQELDIDTLQWRATIQSWSVLECFAHLNLYGDYYLPVIRKRMEASRSQPEPLYTSGFLGAYFAKSMLPKEKLNKMKTFKDKNPIHTVVDEQVIQQFIVQQEELIALIQGSQELSLSKIKIPTSISNLIQLRLGDTFQFLINHMIRHFKQMETVLNQHAASIVSAE
ncbi:DinB family protein [Sphingobacterium sp. HJSM2_6]|uniref:DinB family protein n=1 Tax=Sphingobacterium sp. HJSM2_6 TaxID=3366264 RepID=UPI003BC511E1